MKPSFFLLLILAISACTQNSKSYPYGHEKCVSIVSVQKYASNLLKIKKENEVIIYRIDPCPEMHFNYGYAIVIYRKEKGGLKRRNDFISASKDIYDKAVYKWRNDSVLKVKLYNSNNDLSQEVTQILRKNGGELRHEPYN